MIDIKAYACTRAAGYENVCWSVAGPAVAVQGILQGAGVRFAQHARRLIPRRASIRHRGLNLRGKKREKKRKKKSI